MDHIEQGLTFFEDGSAANEPCSGTPAEQPTADYSLGPRTVRLDTKPPRRGWWLLGSGVVLGLTVMLLVLQPHFDHPRITRPAHAYRPPPARSLRHYRKRLVIRVHIHKQATRSTWHMRHPGLSINVNSVGNRAATNISTDTERGA